MPQRVVQQVAEDLSHPFRIQSQLRELGGDVRVQVNVLRLVGIGHRVGRGRHHRDRLRRAQVQPDLSLFGAGDGADVLRQASQASGLGAQQLGRPVVQRRDPVL